MSNTKGNQKPRLSDKEIEALEMEIYRREGEEIRQDCILKIKSHMTFNEIQVPVRNTKCPPDCLFNMEEIIEIISKSEDRKNNHYVCPICKSQKEKADRSVSNLFYDRKIMVMIKEAAEKLETKHNLDPKQARTHFKKGALHLRHSGPDQQWTYHLEFTKKKQKTSIVFQLLIGQEKQKEERIKFLYDGMDVDLIKKLFSRVLTTQSVIVKDIGRLVSSVSDMDLKKFQEEAAKHLFSTLNKHIIPKVNQNHFSHDYTFTFSNKSYLQPHNSSSSFLNVFFPKYGLLRSFRLQYREENGSKMYTHPERAVYIKDGYKIYVIGGYTTKYSTVLKSKDLKETRQARDVQVTSEVVVIDLSDVINEVFKPTGTVQVKKLKSTAQKQIISTKFSKPLFVTKLNSLKSPVYNSAGILDNGNIYLFGGSTIKKDGTESNCKWSEIHTADSYRYSIKNGKWEAITKLPEPRGGHLVTKFQNSLHIFGGASKENSNEEFKKLWIYNLQNNACEKQTLTFDPSVIRIANDWEKLKLRMLPIKLPIAQNVHAFLIDDHLSYYSYNPRTRMIQSQGNILNYGAYAPKIDKLKPSDSSFDLKFQQIFDNNPPLVSGLYFYGAFEIESRQNLVLFGNRSEWKSMHLFNDGDIKGSSK